MPSEQRRPAVAVPTGRRGRDARKIAPATWRAAIERALGDATPPVLAFQPIADLTRGVVVGYEALARFAGPPVAPPDQWFRAAVELGNGPLEARVITDALASRDALPPGCFLSVNVSPDVLLSPAVSAAFATGGALDRLVVELTEHAATTDFAALVARLWRLRELGAYIAIDDAGSGYSGLTRLLEVRPSFVKLDRGLVVDIDRDPAKRALVETIGTLAGRIDAWIIAEGIERLGELEELVRLGVPLGQGYLLGRPTAAGLRDCPPRCSTPSPPGGAPRGPRHRRAPGGAGAVGRRRPAARAARALPGRPRSGRRGGRGRPRPAGRVAHARRRSRGCAAEPAHRGDPHRHPDLPDRGAGDDARPPRALRPRDVLRRPGGLPRHGRHRPPPAGRQQEVS